MHFSLSSWYSILTNTEMKSNLLTSATICLSVLFFTFYNCVDKNYPLNSQSSNSRFLIQNPYLLYGTLQDTDANVYPTIRLGSQVWMSENLRTTRYANGEAIPNVVDNAEWSSLTTGAQVVYHNTLNSDTLLKFGRLYNFYAVADVRHLAPKGWHVASELDWAKMIAYVSTHLGNSPSLGKALAASVEWSEVSDKDVLSELLAIGADLSFNNSSGFSALPGGYRSDSGEFVSMSRYGDWWTSTQEDANSAWSRYMCFYYTGIYWSKDNLRYGFAVRCVKDEEVESEQ